MDTRQNEKGPPPSFYTTTPSTESTTNTSSMQSTAPTASSCPTAASTSATSTDTTVAIPAKQYKADGQSSSQSSTGVMPKIPHNTSPVAAATSSAVSNTVLAMAGHSVGLDSGGEIGASGGGVSGSGGGQTTASSSTGSTMPSTAASSSMERNDPASLDAGPSGAVQTSSPKLLRPAVFDKVTCYPRSSFEMSMQNTVLKELKFNFNF